MNFKELSYNWMAEKQMSVKPTTMAYYAYLLEHYLVSRLGTKENLTKDDVIDIMNFCAKKKFRKNTTNGIMSVLKMILRYGEKNGLCNSVIFPSGTNCNLKMEVPNILSLKDEKQLITYILKRRNIMDIGILLSITSGLRIGEVCGLQIGDIKAKRLCCHINRTASQSYNNRKHCTEIILGTPKTPNSQRTVPLHASLLALIKDYINNSPDYYVLTQSKTPLNPNHMRAHLKNTLRILNLPQIRFHALRHTFATRCVETGCDIKTLSSILGHSNVQVTLNLYVHPTIEQKRQCLNNMMKTLYS